VLAFVAPSVNLSVLPGGIALPVTGRRYTTNFKFPEFSLFPELTNFLRFPGFPEL